MSSTTTSSGAVLGAATSVGFLTTLFSDWRVSALTAVAILVAGMIIILFTRRRKKKEYTNV